MAIVVLALWIAAAVAGVTLLRAGGATRRAAASVPAESAGAVSAGAVSAGAVSAGAVSAGAASPVKTGVRIGAVPLTAEGKPPPGPHVRVVSPAGEHPFLEFCHPALAVTGIACWLMFVLVHYRPFAWISFGILVATMALGLAWLASTRSTVKHGAGTRWNFPARLVALHGVAVALAIALTVLTAISAST